MNLFNIAIKNIFRNTKRTIFTVLGIASGLSCLLIVGGYYEYNYWGLRESCIRSQYGHIQLSKNGYYENQNTSPYDYVLTDYKKTIEYLEEMPEVEVVSPRLDATALLDCTNGVSSMVLLRGIIPSKENEFNSFFSKKSGKDLKDEDFNCAELGYVLAKKNDIEPGDNFYISLIDKEGFQNADIFTVKSEIGSYSEDFDSKIVRIPLESMQVLTACEGIHEIAVILKDDNSVNKVINKLNNYILQNGLDIHVTSWIEHAGYYNQVVQYYGGYYKIILFIVCVIVFFMSFNAITMNLNERKSEFGTLQSFGVNQNYLTRMICSETLCLSLISICSAFLLSLIITFIITLKGGIYMSPPPGISTEVNIYIKFTLKNCLMAILLGIVGPIISCFVSIIKIQKKTIIDLLNNK